MNKIPFPYRMGITLILLCAGFTGSRAQLMSVKTNLVEDACLMPNASLELTVSPHISIEGEGMLTYRPYGKDRKWATLIPQVKYWTSGRPMAGWNFGVALPVVSYNVVWKGDRYNGDMLGPGITLGYSRPLNSRWNIEFSVGGGYFHYNEYYTPEGGEQTRRNGERVCIFKTGLSIAYVIK